MKPANSETENDIKRKLENITRKRVMYSGNSKTGKVKNELCQSNTASRSFFIKQEQVWHFALKT